MSAVTRALALWMSLLSVLGVAIAKSNMPPARVGLESVPGATAIPWTTIGSSVQGRPILAARFGIGRRRLLYVGGVHGDEFGADVAQHLAYSLAGDPSAVPSGTAIHIVWCLNPDGYAAGTRFNAHHVNLNLNFPASNWAPYPYDPRRGFVHGSAGRAPGSEPETRALVDYLRLGFWRVVALHSKGGIVDYDGPGSKALAARVARIGGFRVSHVYVHNPTGSLGGYVPERYRIPVITVELRSRWLSPRLRDALLSVAR